MLRMIGVVLVVFCGADPQSVSRFRFGGMVMVVIDFATVAMDATVKHWCLLSANCVLVVVVVMV